MLVRDINDNAEQIGKTSDFTEGIKPNKSYAEKDWAVVEKLVNEDKLMEVNYKNKKFCTRKLQQSE